MTEENNAPAFGIEKIFVKDLSFEAPNSPAVFTSSFTPAISLNMNVETEKLGDVHYQVTLIVTATAQVSDEDDAATAFLVEVHQTGIFVLQNIPEQDVRPMLGIECPNILFPYAREAVSDLVTRGGFSPLLLTPVNFAQMYANQMKQEAAAMQEPGNA